MSSSGAVTLGDIADKITMLEVSCSRCGPHHGTVGPAITSNLTEMLTGSIRPQPV
jgi:hypothetical protein